jgi:hypothetical protein
LAKSYFDRHFSYITKLKKKKKKLGTNPPQLGHKERKKLSNKKGGKKTREFLAICGPPSYGPKFATRTYVT